MNNGREINSTVRVILISLKNLLLCVVVVFLYSQLSFIVGETIRGSREISPRREKVYRSKLNHKKKRGFFLSPRRRKNGQNNERAGSHSEVISVRSIKKTRGNFGRPFFTVICGIRVASARSNRRASFCHSATVKTETDGNLERRVRNR